MDIGTGKPGRRELEAAVHYMIDVASPEEYFDAARFCAESRRHFVEIASRGNTPMLVGGTGLYVKAALEGLFPAPARDESLRARLRGEEEHAPGCLYRRLGLVDPRKAKELSPRDLIRIVRALEVYELTGIPMSEAHDSWKPESWPHVIFGLARDREDLYRRIDSRVMEMVREGLFEEVKDLLRAGVRHDTAGMRTIGYREIAAHVRGEIGRDEAISLVQRNSRRYAKRQMTWFGRMRVHMWIMMAESGEGGPTAEMDRLDEAPRSSLGGEMPQPAPPQTDQSDGFPQVSPAAQAGDAAQAADRIVHEWLDDPA
jgi:tRNA dimethylallyltransferase